MSGITGAELLETRMQSVFGLSASEFNRDVMKRVPTAYLNSAIRVVDRSGVIPQIEQWRNEARKSNAGRKAIIPARAVLVLFLLHVQKSLGVNYNQIAKTMAYALEREHFEILGITTHEGGEEDWYKRLWRAANRMLTLIDPYKVPRRRILRDPTEWAALKASLETPAAIERQETLQERLDWLCNALVAGSLAMTPRDIWKRYDGHIAIDATKLTIQGAKNSSNKRVARSNPDPLSARYRREGKHDGKGAKTDEAAYELEATATMWNKPGDNTKFPLLNTAVSFHRPGELAGHGLKLVQAHQALGFGRILLATDRAYNNGRVEDFHLPIRKLGVELIIEYKKDQRGVRGSYGNLLHVDGNWYIDSIPQLLIEITRTQAQMEDEDEQADRTLYDATRSTDLTPEQRETVEQAKEHLRGKEKATARIERIIRNREMYRMVPKGLPDSDGYQRYSYPKGYLPKPTDIGGGARTITIPALIPEAELGKNPKAKRSGKEQPLKHTQKFMYKSKTWLAYYGMRNLVESTFNSIKMVEEIGNPRKRSGRGYAAQYLAATLAIVSGNLRRLRDFFKDESKRDQPERSRERKRKDATGAPLPKHSTSPGPPR